MEPANYFHISLCLSTKLTTNNMRLLVFHILVIFSGTFSFHQTDYHLIIERVDVTFFNKSYISDVKVQTYFFTRYSKRYNVSAHLIQDLDGRLTTFHLDGRKFQSNEYRLFPFNYSENACDNFLHPRFGFTLNKFETNVIPACLTKKGHYYIKNIHYDDSKFPPYAPRGRYLVLGRAVYKKDILLLASETYIEIKAQNPLERTIGG